MLDMAWTVPVFVVAPLIAAVSSSFFNKNEVAVKIIVALCMMVLLILPILTDSYVYFSFGAHPSVTDPGSATPLWLGINYKYTQIQMILLATFAVMSTFIMIIALRQQEKASGVYMALLMLVLASVGALVLVDDIFNMFVFFEIATISQVGIIAAMGTGNSYKTAMKYLLIGGVGGAMLLLSIVFLLGSTSTLNITNMVQQIQAMANKNTAPMMIGFGLLVFAWTYGAGIFPFHAIKAEVYGRVLPHAGALLQATSKLILIAVGLIILQLFGSYTSTWIWLLIPSLLAMVIGGAMAMLQNDYRRLLAYVAVSQAGVVGIGFALYSADLAAVTFGIFHGFNEIIIASALFLTAGYLYALKGTTNLNSFGGMIFKQKAFAVLTLLLMLAVAGIPPFNTFQSEWNIIRIAFEAGNFPVGILMVIATVMTFFALLKAFYAIFLKPSDDNSNYDTKVPMSITVTIIVAIIIGLTFGFWPSGVTNTINTVLGTYGI